VIDTDNRTTIGKALEEEEDDQQNGDSINQ
jgi:hypothetical protein